MTPEENKQDENDEASGLNEIGNRVRYIQRKVGEIGEQVEDNYKMLYVPEQFAHGFVTLSDITEVTYQVSQFYAPGAEQGIRFDDPAIGIEWPLEAQVISDKDAAWPNVPAADAMFAAAKDRT